MGGIPHQGFDVVDLARHAVGEIVAAALGDQRIILDADADVPECFRHVGGRADVAAGFDGQHHARQQRTPFAAELVFARIVDIHAQPVAGAVHVEAAIVALFHDFVEAALEQAKIAGVDILLDIDCQGARILKERGIKAQFVFVVPPSMAELRRRLEARSTDEPEVIEQRIARATEEIRESRWYDYILVNDRLEDAGEALAAIVTSARHTTARLWGQVSKMFDI